MNIKTKYKEEMDSVAFSVDFESKVKEKLCAEVKNEKETFNMKKTLKILIVAAVVCVLLTTSVFAITKFLSVKEVLNIVDATQIESAFEGENSITVNKTIVDKGYKITLMGVASGSQLVEMEFENIEEQRQYIVASVSKEDGTMFTADDTPFTFGIFVKGEKPWQVCACGGLTRLIANGVEYFVLDYEALSEYKAEKYLTVYEGGAPSNDILCLDKSGNVVYADGYDGIKAQFSLAEIMK